MSAAGSNRPPMDKKTLRVQRCFVEYQGREQSGRGAAHASPLPGLEPDGPRKDQLVPAPMAPEDQEPRRALRPLAFCAGRTGVALLGGQTLVRFPAAPKLTGAPRIQLFKEGRV